MSATRKSLTAPKVGRVKLTTGSRVEYAVTSGTDRKKVLGTIVYGPGPFHLKPNENDWCGVTLDEPYGKNNGTIQGRQYFECADNFGLFVRANTLKLVREKKSGSGSTTPSTTPSMTPSSSIASFTGMFDSGQSSSQQQTSSKTSESMTGSMSSKLRPPTQIATTSSLTSGSSQDLSTFKSSIPAPSAPRNIRQMVAKIETNQDERIREQSNTQDIGAKGVTASAAATVGAIVSEVSSPTSSPSRSLLITNAAELQELRDKNKDLESKLATLMVKRAEDRAKFKDIERLKIQNEQLLENKKQMAEKIAELSRLKSLAEQEAKEAREEHLKHGDEMKELIDNAEMAVIDKEMAENKAEQLQIELEQVKEQLEEARIDFELLKSEIEDKGVDGAAGSFQVKQLEEQNARYKDALLKFRDITATDRSNIQVLQKELEQKSEEVVVLMADKDKACAELTKCHEEIEDLKEQIDMALGSQEMVEKLTEKNLNLEDKVEDLQRALDEEENIKELSNMIIEEKDEIIADLRDEVDKYKTSLANLKNNYLATQEVVQDHENTIKKFRQLVSALKDEIQMLRTTSEQDSSKVAQAVDVQKQLENIEFKTRLSDRRNLSRAIDMELRQLDVDQCYRYMVYLARFFPESFFAIGNDHDAIAVLLFISRMFTKCTIVERQITDKYSTYLAQNALTPDSIVHEVFQTSSTPSEQTQIESIDKLKQQIFTRHILYLLCSIKSILGKYQEVLSRCNTDMFMKVASLFLELSPHEKNIDHYVDLLRQDKLDETVTLDSLEKTLNYLQSLYNIHMASEFEGDKTLTVPIGPADNHNKFLNDLLEVFRTATEASILDVKIISQLVTSDLSLFTSHLSTTFSDIDHIIKKIRRRMVSAGGGQGDTNPAYTVRFSSVVQAELLDSVQNLSMTVRCLKTIRATLVAQYMNHLMQTSRNDSTSGDGFTCLDNSQLEQISKELTGNSLKVFTEMLSGVVSSVSKFCTSLQQGDYDLPKGQSEPSSGPNSLSSSSLLSMQHYNSLQSIQNLFSSSNSANTNRVSLQTMHCHSLDDRALKWRAQSDKIGEYSKKIAAQEVDIGKLERALKAKLDEISELQIRRDIAENKHMLAQEKLVKLQEDVDRLHHQLAEVEAEKERTLTKYNQEISELYSDQRIMKEKLKDYSKNVMISKSMMMSSPIASSSPLNAGDNNISLISSPASGHNQSALSLSSSLSGHHSMQSFHSVASTASTATPALSSNNTELQQEVIDLRALVKRLTKRNYDLRMLACNDRLSSRYDSSYELDERKRLKEMQLSVLRQKLIDFKHDLAHHQITSNQMPDFSEIYKKPGWSRNLMEIKRKFDHEKKLKDLEMAKRFQVLKGEVEQFIKTFDEGYACEASFANFMAPHVSKMIDYKREHIATITIIGKSGLKDGQDQKVTVIPLEVTMAQLKQISASILL